MCLESFADSDMVWTTGMATCVHCHRKRLKAWPWVLLVMGLVFVLLAGSIIGFVLWRVGEDSKRKWSRLPEFAPHVERAATPADPTR
jgi:hypothetical protein